MPDLTYPSGPDELRAYLAVPAGQGPWPGVVVLHEAWGLNDDIRAQADRFAAGGYVALAPDLYSAGPRLRCIRRTFQDLLARRGRSFEHLEAARAWLAAREDCTGRAGLIGFCLGGGFALVAAARSGFAAVAPNYGILPRRASEVLEGACPVVASYGRRDLTLRNTAAKLERTLTELGVVHDVKEYPEAGHSFMTDFLPGPPMNLVGKIVLRAGPVASASDDAWERVFAFFGEHVAGPKEEAGPEESTT